MSGLFFCKKSVVPNCQSQTKKSGRVSSPALYKDFSTSCSLQIRSQPL